MTKLPLAYVIPSRPRPDVAAAVERQEWPRFELDLFLERNGVERLDLGRLDECRAGPVRWLQRWHKDHWSLAAYGTVKRNQYAGFITTGEDVGLPLAVMAGSVGYRKPIFLITHGSYFGSPWFARLAPLTRTASNVHFLCLSDSLRRRLVEEYGVASSQAHNSSYGVDTDFFHPSYHEETTRPLIVSAGTASRDYRTLMRAVDGLNADVQVAADSAWYREPVNVGGDEIPPNVTIKSSGDYRGLRDLYSRAAFVVVPLRDARHACGYAVIAEAMAMGKAVIATRTSSPDDFVLDGSTGFHTRPGDVEDLRARMQAFIDDPGLAREMGRRARVRMEREFSVEAYDRRLAAAVTAAGIDCDAAAPAVLKPLRR